MAACRSAIMAGSGDPGGLVVRRSSAKIQKESMVLSGASNTAKVGRSSSSAAVSESPARLSSSSEVTSPGNSAKGSESSSGAHIPVGIGIAC